MKVLIFGGTQFVGRHTAEVLLAHGYQVAVLNRGVSPDHLPPEVERIRADRTQAEQVIQALRGRAFDAVVDCIGFRPEDVQTAIHLFRGRIQRYVFISSVSVYRASSLFPIEETFPVLRGSGWQYAQQKVECEDALLSAFRDEGFPCVILRPAYIYGPYNNQPEWEFKFFARIELGRKVLIPGDGSFIFHHGHARDLAFAVMAAIQRPQAVGNIYNITGPHAATAKAYVETVAAAMERPVEIVHVPGPLDRRSVSEYFPFQPRPNQIYSIEKARRDLAWEPRFDLLAGHRDTYRWYVESGYAETHRYDFSREDEILASLGAG